MTPVCQTPLDTRGQQGAGLHLNSSAPGARLEGNLYGQVLELL